jgi:glycosyltransferase involved in cell wall biosynthesis
LHIVIDAFNEISGSAELIIAGDETKFPDYVRDLQRRAAHPDIHFAGRLNRSEVWQTLVNSDVVVVPSLWFETFSMLTHEAFAVGKPVIASAHGALEEAIRHNVDGLLIPPGDVSAWHAAMQRLVDNPDLLARLQTNVRPPITLEEHVDQVEALYTQLVDSAPQAC